MNGREFFVSAPGRFACATGFVALGRSVSRLFGWDTHRLGGGDASPTAARDLDHRPLPVRS